MNYLYVFLLMTALDLAYTEYVKASAKNEEIRGPLWASVTIVINVFLIRAYVYDVWLVIPATFGAFFGTWLSIRFMK